MVDDVADSDVVECQWRYKMPKTITNKNKTLVFKSISELVHSLVPCVVHDDELDEDEKCKHLRFIVGDMGGLILQLMDMLSDEQVGVAVKESGYSI